MSIVLPAVLALVAIHELRAEVNFEQEIRPILENYCFDCHGAGDDPKGGFNLERFAGEQEVMAERGVWSGVFEKIESHQMPPPKRKSQPSREERASVLQWIREVSRRPDPRLGKRDPGKPMLRRLTRLEYNNTVRDLFGLKMDVFMFPESLPIANRAYFLPGAGSFGNLLEVPVREYGMKYPVLLPEMGLPGDNRAEHGYRNQGEAMNLSALTFEKYLASAHDLTWSPKLPRLSMIFEELVRDPSYRPGAIPAPVAEQATEENPEWLARAEFAPNLNMPFQASDGEVVTLDYQFRFAMESAVAEGIGGTWDTNARSLVVKAGAQLRVRFGTRGDKALSMTPKSDLWVAGFSTAGEVSGESLFTNHEQLAKVIELDFKISSPVEGEGITELAVCVLSREGYSGTAQLRAKFSGGGSSELSHELIEGGGVGNTFFAFRAPPNEHIVGLVADGSGFSGNHFLLDDLAFLTDGGTRPLVKPEIVKPMSDEQKREVAEERLVQFLPKAFRRPVEHKLVTRYLGVFDDSQERGKDFEGAMKDTIAAVLTSPNFLYLSESAAGEGKVRALDDDELASRLSYFLWASRPDDELLAAAAAGELQSKEGIEKQTRRMLRDPRVRELGESFAMQWLRLDQLTSAKPDPSLYENFYGGPQGKVTLHSSMLVEALLLFETVLVEDRSILDFLNADDTWLNLRLAKLYGIDVPELGSKTSDTDVLIDAKLNARWARVKVQDAGRGGYLSMAGPLTVTSLPTRTSPVKRGAWVLETILNRPPQEPKVAFVLKEDTTEVKTVRSIRERFEQHRNKPSCFSCHIRLDPPGFALERFDGIGAWRETDGGQAVDARATWGDRSFDGPTEFKAILAAEPHEFVRGFIEHLLRYALCRELEIYDMPVVEELEKQVMADHGKLKSLIVAITTSYPFRHLRDADLRQ
jgi:hypothetical protein